MTERFNPPPEVDQQREAVRSETVTDVPVSQTPPSQTPTPEATAAAHYLGDRRRPGRVHYANPHLIQMLRRRSHVTSLSSPDADIEEDDLSVCPETSLGAA